MAFNFSSILNKPLSVILNPRKEIYLVRNTHFSGSICTSLSCNRLETDLRRFKCSDSVLTATKISSAKQHTPGKLVNILSMVYCHNAGLEAILEFSLLLVRSY